MGVLALLLCCQAATSIDSRDFQQAQAAIRNNDYAGAIQILSRMIATAKGRELLDLYGLRRQCYMAQGNKEKALADLIAARKIDPNSFALTLSIVQLERQMHRSKAALNVIDEWIKRCPASAAYSFRAQLECDLGDYRAAAADFTTALEIFENANGANELRANANNHIGNYDLSLVDLFDLLYAPNVDTRISVEYTKKYLSDFPRAVPDWNKELKSGKTAGKLYGRAMCLFFLGEFSAAESDLVAAHALDPKFVPLYPVRMLVLMRLGKRTEARKVVDDMLRLKPDSIVSYQTLDRYFYMSGNHDALIDDLSERIKNDPKNAMLYLARGRANLMFVHTDPALADFTTAIKLNKNLSAAYYGRAQVYMSIDKSKQAMPDLTAANKLDPSNCDVLNDRVLAYMHQGQYQSAVDDLTVMIKKRFRISKCLRVRAQCYAKLGDKKAEEADLTRLRSMREI